MHRRARHLNARDAGATMVLDARFIAGNDGDAVGTWESRTTSTYNFTQATTANKPLLKIGANGMGGQHSVLFDGSNDYLTGPSEAVSTYSIFIAAKAGALAVKYLFSSGNSTSSDVQFGIDTPNNASLPNRVRNRRVTGVNYFCSSDDFVIGNVCVISAYHDGTTMGIRVNGKTEGTQTPSGTASTNPWVVGTINGSTSTYYNSNIGAVIMFKNSVTSAAVRKRLEHSLGFSFKIQTN